MTHATDFPTPAEAEADTVLRDTHRILSEIAGGEDITDPFAAAVRATRMPMIVTDARQPDNPIIFVNDAFSRLTGYARDEIIGWLLYQLRRIVARLLILLLVAACARSPIDVTPPSPPKRVVVEQQAFTDAQPTCAPARPGQEPEARSLQRRPRRGR